MEHSLETCWQVPTHLPSLSGLANSIISQLVRNGAQKIRDHESTRLVEKVSDLWKVTTLEGDSISGHVMPRDCCHHQPPKASKISIFLELILHARSALKSWTSVFCISNRCQFKLPRSGEELSSLRSLSCISH